MNRSSSAPSHLDPVAIRRDFPALMQEINGYPLAYLDNAATTQKPESVIRAIADYYRRDNANVHRGIYELSRRATEAFEGARSRVAGWIGAAEPAEVVWTRGTTESINLVASSWGGANLREGDEILISEMEHHSNIVPWQVIADRTGARLRFLPIDDEGRLQLDRLPSLLTERTRIAALTHVSNALGTINPIREIAPILRRNGTLLLVDGAQSVPHLRVDVSELGADFYAFSGHKMCGPTGIGVLWARRELLEAMPPYQGGGEMIRTVDYEGSTWAEVPHKFEAGTPNVAGAVGLAAAADYLAALDANAVAAHERDLVNLALDRLKSFPGLSVLGPGKTEDRIGVISFVLEHVHPHDVSTVLDAEGVAIRAGHHCTQLVMKRFRVPATTRASFYIYNTRDDVDRLMDGLESVRRLFG